MDSNSGSELHNSISTPQQAPNVAQSLAITHRFVILVVLDQSSPKWCFNINNKALISIGLCAVSVCAWLRVYAVICRVLSCFYSQHLWHSDIDLDFMSLVHRLAASVHQPALDASRCCWSWCCGRCKATLSGFLWWCYNKQWQLRACWTT